MQKSNEIFRYAIPAAKLLLSTGNESLAKHLPIQVDGTLREMVFYFYQDKKNPQEALRYANKWLELNPNDLEIILYQIRCYSSFRTSNDFLKAESIISDIEKRGVPKRFAARLYREKALIEDRRGNRDNAKTFYRKGIEIYGQSHYPENHVGLAQILLREIEDSYEFNLDGSRPIHILDKILEAKSLLEEARRRQSMFDRLHLGSYVEALIQAGEEDKALPLLLEALVDNPQDEKLTYRYAEILRKQGKYAEAITYAERAKMLGYHQAIFTLANISFSEAMEVSDETIKNHRLQDALKRIKDFQPRHLREEEVMDGMIAKIYRNLGDWKNARQHVLKHLDTKNSYIIYEIFHAELDEASEMMQRGDYLQSLSLIKAVKDRIEDFKQNPSIPQSFSELFGKVSDMEIHLKQKLGDTND